MASWYDTAWKYRIDLDLDSSKAGGATHTDFRAWIALTNANLKSVSNGGKCEDSTCRDFIFVSDDQTTKLDHEIIKHDPATGEIGMWVRVPSYSHTANTKVSMYFGNASISTDQSNRTGVWGSDYEAALHCEDNAGNTNVADASQNDYTFTAAANTSTLTVSGKINNAFSYNGSSDYLKRAYNANLNPSQFTIRAWVYSTGGGGSFRAIASSRDGSNPSQTKGWILYHHPDGFVAGWTGTNGSGWDNVNGTTTLTSSTWYLVHFTYDGTNSAVYVNGTSEANAAKSYTPNATYETRIGAGENENATPNFWFPGRIDEPWICSFAYAPARVTAEYNNQSNPGTFYSVGSLQTLVQKDIAARFRLRSADLLKDITARFRLRSADQLKDIAARFRLRSTDQLKDISARLRLMSASQLKDIVARFRLMSASQLKDVTARFRLMSANQLKDISARLRLMSAMQLRDIASRFVLGAGSTHMKDISCRFVLASPATIIAYGRSGSVTGYGRSGNATGEGR